MKRIRYGTRTITIAGAAIIIEGMPTVDGSYVQVEDGGEVIQTLVSFDSVEEVFAGCTNSLASTGTEYEVSE